MSFRKDGHRMRKGLNLLNKKYNFLTAIKKIENDKYNNCQWLCKCDCGKGKIVIATDLKRNKVKSCGCLTRGPKINKKVYVLRKKGRGYIYFKSPNHPNRTREGFVLEHRLIMEKYIGRLLINEETVHHKNGLKDDNRIENLELWEKCHPMGRRIKDMIEFCVNYLKEHRPEILVIN